AMVQELCQQLSARLRDKRRIFSCQVLCDPLPNAMALPGGFLFVSHSLADLCERDPQQLAFVIGHEMAHVVRGHAWDRMINEAALRMASTVTARVGPVGNWLRQQGFALLRSAYDQDCESEADELGLRLAVAAGFDPAGAVALLQRVQRLEPKVTELGQYFASHPPASHRIARLARLHRQLEAARAGSPGQ
ncbi:MAG TPA: M48 family metallopeptidase, partial [Bacillota bacterium]|nr:M48 family metallopeptidase [Bacillota bacterium]